MRLIDLMATMSEWPEGYDKVHQDSTGKLIFLNYGGKVDHYSLDLGLGRIVSDQETAIVTKKQYEEAKWANEIGDNSKASCFLSIDGKWEQAKVLYRDNRYVFYVKKDGSAGHIDLHSDI